MKLTTEQVNTILTHEDNERIWEITHKIKHDENITLPDETIDDLFNRLHKTYHYLMGLKFDKRSLIEAFLYGEAVTPGYKDNPMIKNWVEKAGEIPENQYEDLLIIADKMQKGLL